MNFTKGIKELISEQKRMYQYKIRHFGEDKVNAIAMSNLCVNNKFHVFYDIDGKLDISSPLYQVIHTKHGIQLIGVECLNISEVKSKWDEIHSIHPTDYYWSIPLYLRISPKWSQSGSIISPKPDTNEQIIAHFPVKKSYMTWD